VYTWSGFLCHVTILTESVTGDLQTQWRMTTWCWSSDRWKEFTVSGTCNINNQVSKKVRNLTLSCWYISNSHSLCRQPAAFPADSQEPLQGVKQCSYSTINWSHSMRYVTSRWIKCNFIFKMLP